jgi:hypothetical protein
MFPTEYNRIVLEDMLSIDEVIESLKLLLGVLQTRASLPKPITTREFFNNSEHDSQKCTVFCFVNFPNQTKN